MMTAQEMWELYSRRENLTAEYEAWAFGDQPDVLADLVLRGIKTGTSSLHLWYEREEEPLPRVGEYSVILDSDENAVCVTKTTKVYVLPFDRVPPEHAWREGEGDRSLAYWQKVHEEFFSTELREIGVPFHKQMQVVCEEFLRVYP